MSDNNTFISFFHFIRSPDYLSSPKKPISKKFLILFKFYLLSILLLWIARGIDFIFISLKLYDPYNYSIVKYQSSIDSSSYSFLILIVLIITPIFEEITFRLFLKKFNLVYFSISVSLLIGSFVYLVFKNSLWYPHVSYAYVFMPFVYLIAFFIPVLFVVYSIMKRTDKIETNWNSNFPILFYVLTILFSIYHLPTLNLNVSHYLFLPITLMPFIIYAIILGFIRIRLGIVYSVILHYIYLIPSFISFLSKNV